MRKTKKIIEKIFNHLKYEILATQIDGDKAYMVMAVQNIDCRQAWYNASIAYANLCLENAFSEKYLYETELYLEYLDNMEKAIKDADYVLPTVEVEMNLENHRWVCELSDELVDAITGGLLTAMEEESPIVYADGLLPTFYEYSAKVVGFQKKKDWENKNSVYLTINLTNNSNEAISYDEVMWTLAYQEDYKLNPSCPLTTDKDNYKLYFNREKVLKPGESIEILEVYNLKSNSNIIEVKTYNYLTNDLINTYNLGLNM